MSCNGKMYPISSDLKFDIVAFGSKAKGKFMINALYNQKTATWQLK